ncbi:kinase [Bacillus sp. JJ1609]|uniref:kinase n=1 Tax=Bacillus sp. JJ1609 TaxID=3122977 RepID=UPI002FFF317F
MQNFVSLFESVNRAERFIVGIDGLSRSGKTTLVKNLGNVLEKMDIPYQILHIDDFIVERPKRYHTGNDEWYEYYSLQWDVHWLKENLFEKLPWSETLMLPFYDHEKDRQVFKEVGLKEAAVVIVEGVFLSREEWRNFFDYIAFLDCPREVRFCRESSGTQQNLQKFEQRYWKAEDFYLETESPKDKANLIIPFQLLKE